MPAVYAGAAVALGTMHGKDAAIAPALGDTIGVSVRVPAGLDTDRFGTFTRDVARTGSMEDAARAKAAAAMVLTGLPLGLASEGSYGPHPALPMIPGGHELLLFVDRARNLAIAEHLVTAEVNFARIIVRDIADLSPFLRRVGFPAQQLVLRPADQPDAAEGLSKGIADPAQLDAAFAVARACAATGEVLVETDMRAFANPQRMATIGRLARRLGERLARHCPACNSPGFGGDRPVPGRPCAECGTPTALPRAMERICVACGFTAHAPVDETAADPAHCPLCNP